MFFLDHIKLKYKLFLVYIFCVFCPIIITNIIFYQKMTYNVKELQKNYYRLSAQRIVAQVENDINLVISLCNRISFEQTLYEMLEKEYPDAVDYVEAYYTYFVDFLFFSGESYRQVNTATLYTDNEYILHSGSIFRINDTIRAERWFQEVVQEPEKTHVIYGKTTAKSNNMIITPISVIKMLNVYKGLDKYLKIIKMNLNTEKMINIITAEKLKGDVYIIDRKGNLLFADHKPTGDWDFEKFLKNNREQVITERIDKDLDWTVISVINRQEINMALRAPRNYIILLTICSLLVASVIIIIISHSFYNRLNALSEHVNNLAEEDFCRQYSGPQGTDEIGSLINAFNKMVIKIKTLIKDVYEAKLEQSRVKLEKKQAELNALQSQMNPHYLFNTLESIRMKALEKGEKETAGMIKYLARSFQRMIDFRQEWVRVAEEISYIEDFLKIQKYRFGTEFEYSLDIDPAVLNYKIPKLIIQPFVENACLHGIEGSEEVGTVQVRIRLIDGKLKCIICDNGVGMSERKLQSLLKDIKNQDIPKINIAIRNIYQRLNLYFGNSFKLLIDSKEGKGTVITLIIPTAV